MTRGATWDRVWVERGPLAGWQELRQGPQYWTWHCSQQTVASRGGPSHNWQGGKEAPEDPNSPLCRDTIRAMPGYGGRPLKPAGPNTRGFWQAGQGVANGMSSVAAIRSSPLDSEVSLAAATVGG